MKRFCCLIISFLLVAVPILGQLSFNVYAVDSNSPVSRQQLVQAFKAYCKSRDMTIEGSILDAVDNFTSDTMERICKTLGIDITELQAEINAVYQPDSNIVKYWAFTVLGINGFNRIFAQLLQDNSLSVGDENVDKVVKTGRWFQDLDGVGCWCSIINDSSIVSPNNFTGLNEYGTAYVYDIATLADVCKNNTSYSSVRRLVEGQTVTLYLAPNNQFIASGYRACNVYTSAFPQTQVNYDASRYRSGNVMYDGYVTVCYNTANNYLFLGGTRTSDHQFKVLLRIQSNTATDTDVKVTSPVIKPDLPEDPCNIAPDGNVTPTDQDPTEPPPDPTGGTPPDWDLDTDVEPDDDGGFKIPFNLPDLDIDWSISGLQNKFPFSIPFDIYNLCSILNATPQAPHFTGELDLKLYTWEIDIDLSEFDGMARILRIMELIGFVIGLAFVTRYMIKG